MTAKTSDKHGFTGEETFEIRGLNQALDSFAPGKTVEVIATGPDGKSKSFQATLRIDTPQEVQYYRHGGILHYVVRQLASAAKN